MKKTAICLTKYTYSPSNYPPSSSFVLTLELVATGGGRTITLTDIGQIAVLDEYIGESFSVNEAQHQADVHHPRCMPRWDMRIGIR